MSAIYNRETHEIICPRCDTGFFEICLDLPDGTPFVAPEGAVLVFGVCKKATGREGYIDGRGIVVPIVNGKALLHITNAFSREFLPDQYYYDFRYVSDPEYREDDGTVYCADESDEVHSIFALLSDVLPKYTVRGGSIDV